MFWEYTLEIALVPTVATLFLYLYNSFYKKENAPFQTYYNLYFALLVIRMFFFGLESHASIVNNHYLSSYYMDNENTNVSFENYFNEITKAQIRNELHFLDNIECLTKLQFKEYQKKLDYELQEGHRCFNEARKLCLLIPNSTDKEKAQKLFEIAVATAVGFGISGYSGIIGALAGHLALYLKKYIEE